MIVPESYTGARVFAEHVAMPVNNSAGRDPGRRYHIG
jgi:hypothetical protein